MERNTMNIEIANALKVDIESKIGAHINWFCKKTGLQVSDIILERNETKDAGGQVLYAFFQVRLKVEL